MCGVGRWLGEGAVYLLIKMMKIQVENNDMHTVDYRMIKKIDSKKELNILSEGLNP